MTATQFVFNYLSLFGILFLFMYCTLFTYFQKIVKGKNRD